MSEFNVCSRQIRTSKEAPRAEKFNKQIRTDMCSHCNMLQMRIQFQRIQRINK